MSKILIPSRGAEDWQRLLAEPEKHWRSGCSAKALAHCWEAAAGFPPSVHDLFADSRFDAAYSPQTSVDVPAMIHASISPLNTRIAQVIFLHRNGFIVLSWISVRPRSHRGRGRVLRSPCPCTDGRRIRLDAATADSW